MPEMNSHFICKIGLRAAEQFNNEPRRKCLSFERKRGRTNETIAMKTHNGPRHSWLVSGEKCFCKSWNNELPCDTEITLALRMITKKWKNFFHHSRLFLSLLGNENAFRLPHSRILFKNCGFDIWRTFPPIHVNYNLIKLLWLPFATF